MKKLLAAFLFCSSLFFVSTVFAHDGAWGDANTPLEINWIGSGSQLDLLHVDADPFKGWATITMKNTCGQDWGDFHLRLYSTCGSDVDFVNSSSYQPELWLKVGSTWVKDTDLTWTIPAGGDIMNLFFYDDPIVHGEIAKIRVYTDNTVHCWSSFNIASYPTPVPEPATITLLCIGALALTRRK